MAAFTHISTDHAGRFHDGNFGTFYAANQFETAGIETAVHYGQFYASTKEPSGWIVEMRELVGEINTQLIDIRMGGYEGILDPESDIKSQSFAIEIHNQSYKGIVSSSVRGNKGECFAMFYPDVCLFLRRANIFLSTGMVSILIRSKY